MELVKNKLNSSQIHPTHHGRSYLIDETERIYQRFHLLSNSKLLSDTARDIQHNLQHYGISFEGRALPVSLTPTVIPKSELIGVANDALLIRQVLNRMLGYFTEEHRERHFDGPFHRFFTPYYRWWDLIAREHRDSDHVQLMRYDAVRDDDGRWSFIETNAACPGGTIHCARIRHAWLSTKLGHELTKFEKLSTSHIDDSAGFVRFLHQKAMSIDPENPNIAILNYKGTYTNELTSLRNCHQEMRGNAQIDSGELILGDIREIVWSGGKAILHGKPVAIIYNKLDPLQIEPSDTEIAGWVRSSEGSKTEFLNSLGSMYLAETKRTLALLSDPKWSHYLHLSPEEDQAIRNVIPFTRLIEDYIQNGSLEDSLPARKKDSFVAKADALTRGHGVAIGELMNQQEWFNALHHVRDQNGIAQLKCNLPIRPGFFVGQQGNIEDVSEYFGVDVFLFGDEFAGVVSRSHTHQIFNIGNGGRESPVLVVEELQWGK